MEAEDQALIDGVEVVWAANYESGRRTQNRLAQRRYREKRKLKAQQENDGSVDTEDSLAGIDVLNWVVDPVVDPCIASFADMNVLSTGNTPADWGMQTQSAYSPSSGQNPQLHMSGDSSGGGLPVPELSTYVDKLSNKARGLIDELQQLYRIGVDLEMLRSDSKLATDLGILPDRFAALIALHQSSDSMNGLLAQCSYSEDLFDDDADTLRSVTSHVSVSSRGSK